ncbi:MAG: hypothetical protein CMP91_01100 [Gammaproteobacteria bacterium]|nr:hypothetical protein [Gammaproteobacteria bacterium]MAY03433.1 hypothetical protein [Gammaproteobacteria bacterium]|tara:strand:+ start:653 stop:937 length:285 start_codon:yes stop_codon:yes gene_type:complete
MSNNDNHYWKENIRILSILLGIWFVVSFLMSVIFVDQLDVIRIGGFGFGFWMAQQGSIYIYVILIFVYLKLMDRLDKKYHHEEKDILEEENRID